ncbi:putative rRNA-processing protein EBP2 [Chamberlinius hualienensis]
MVTTMELSSDSDSDSDKELQRAFAEKEIQPGVFKLVPQRERIVINNITGLKDKLNQLKLNLPWIERLDFNNDVALLAPELAKKLEAETAQTSFVENEFKREIHFYRQAQATVLEGIPKLHDLGVPTKRPIDYFAQMAKSDEHMKKVREQLLNKQTVIERKEKLRKLREMKKYGKQVQQEVIQKRKEEKKTMMESVHKFRKSQKNKSEDDHFNSKPVDKNPKNKLKKKQQERQDFKDKKFGFGGQKKKKKFNDRESAADTSEFRRGKPMGQNRKKFQNKNKGKGRRK